MGLFNWSKTANSNSTADPTINWAEGQAPSTVNDSARSMMAAIAMYRDDIAGSIVTGGTSTAYTVSSNSGFDTLAHLNGQIIAFTPNVTNGATVTLNVDSLGAKPLRTAPGVELQSNTLIPGTPYVAVYNNTDGAFYLQGLGSNTYGIPLGVGMDFWLSTTPSSAFVFPTGQAISRTTYATLFNAMGTTYGSGDGSTTFNLPDKRGRASIAADSSAGRISTATMSAVTIGGTGGTETETLTAGQIPSITSVVSATSSPTGGLLTAPTTGFGVTMFSANAGAQVWQAFSQGANIVPVSSITASGSATSNNTGGAAHLNMPPSIVCNYIMRII